MIHKSLQRYNLSTAGIQSTAANTTQNGMTNAIPWLFNNANTNLTFDSSVYKINSIY